MYLSLPSLYLCHYQTTCSMLPPFFKLSRVNILFTLVPAHTIKFTIEKIATIFEDLLLILIIANQATKTMRQTILKTTIINIIMSNSFSFNKPSFLPISTELGLFINWCKTTSILCLSISKISLIVSLFGN